MFGNGNTKMQRDGASGLQLNLKRMDTEMPLEQPSKL